MVMLFSEELSYGLHPQKALSSAFTRIDEAIQMELPQKLEAIQVSGAGSARAFHWFRVAAVEQPSDQVDDVLSPVAEL